MLVYDIAAASATSAAITSAALTFGQAQLLLSDATALDDVVLAIAAVAVCGNGVCELGERPNATAIGVNATGTGLALLFDHCVNSYHHTPVAPQKHKEDIHAPFVHPSHSITPKLGTVQAG